MTRVFFLVYRWDALTVVLVGLLFLFSWGCSCKKIESFEQKNLIKKSLNKIYDLRLYCCTAVKRESLFTKVGLLKAESIFDIVVGGSTGCWKSFCVLNLRILGSNFVLISWGPGYKINKIQGLDEQGSQISGRRKFKRRKQRNNTKGE